MPQQDTYPGPLDGCDCLACHKCFAFEDLVVAAHESADQGERVTMFHNEARALTLMLSGFADAIDVRDEGRTLIASHSPNEVDTSPAWEIALIFCPGKGAQ